MFSDYNMVAFFVDAKPKAHRLRNTPSRKDHMDNQPIITSNPDSEQDTEAALRAEANRSLTNAYEAVADFMKDLVREEQSPTSPTH